MIKGWLQSASRANAYSDSFELVDIVAETRPTSEQIEYFGNAMRSNFVDPGFLVAANQYLNWTQLTEWVAGSTPRLPTLQRGAFGEMLAGGILEEIHHFQVPISKLRYRITQGQSLPGTDVIAVQWNVDDGVVGVHFVEVKLRSTSNRAKQTVTQAYLQLLECRDESKPAMLKFIAERLYERQDPLFAPFMTYLGNREDLSHMDSFRVFLVWDAAHWADGYLEDLAETEVELSPLTLHIVKLDSLVDLVDAVFDKVPCLVQDELEDA